ncbi:MAG: carbohydrate porin [Phycisphaerae bacterium]|nr:carbohydrate porin [Phycisphaerae bacterium]
MTARRFCVIMMLALFGDFARAQSTRPAAQGNADGNATAEPVATSQPAPPPFFRLDYSGDLLHRPALTGDWGGVRSQLAEKGISFNVETLNYTQGNAHGGRSTNNAFRYGGSADYILQLDTGRMGLWPGGYFKIRGETRWGEGITEQVGAIAPPHFDAILPALEPNGVTTLTEYYMMQVLSEKLGVIAGQVDPSRLPGGNVFTTDPYGQFMNTAIWQNVASFSVVPYSAMTAGLIYMPTKWLSGATMVMDSYGLPSFSGFESAFHSPQATTILQGLTLNIKPFNLDGHQRFNFAYSTREHTQLDDLGRLAVAGVPVRPFSRLGFPESPAVLGRRWRLPSALLRAAARRALAPDPTNSQNWAFWYDFDQYLYQSPEDPTQGFGLFGGFGLTPGNWFPVSQSYTLGLGGKGLIHGRPGDRYGVGYYCLNLSSDIPALFDLNAEQGVEVFYNFEVTPWCHITPDLQIIAHPGGGDQDVAVVYGLRMQVSF